MYVSNPSTWQAEGGERFEFGVRLSYIRPFFKITPSSKAMGIYSIQSNPIQSNQIKEVVKLNIKEVY